MWLCLLLGLLGPSSRGLAQSHDPIPRSSDRVSLLVFEPTPPPEWQVERWIGEMLPFLDVTDAARLSRPGGPLERARRLEELWLAVDPRPETWFNEARVDYETSRRFALETFGTMDDPRARLVHRLGRFEERIVFGDCFAATREPRRDVERFLATSTARRTCTLPHLELLAWPAGENQAPAALFYRRLEECRRLTPGQALIANVSPRRILRRLAQEGCFDAAPRFQYYFEPALLDPLPEAELGALGLRLRRASPRSTAPSSRPRSRPDFRIERLVLATPGEGALAIGPPGIRVEGLLELSAPRPTRNIEATSGEAPTVTIQLTGFLETKRADRPRVLYEDIQTLPLPETGVWRLPWSARIQDEPSTAVWSVRFDHPDGERWTAFASFDVDPDGLGATGMEAPSSARETVLWQLLDSPRIRLPDELSGLWVGATRVVPEIDGLGVAEVRYRLDGSEVARAEGPGFSTVIDFGPVPAPRTLEVRALDAAGAELDRDSVLVNPGAHRFEIRLGAVHQPAPNLLAGRYRLHVPADGELERVELLLDDESLGIVAGATGSFRRAIPPRANGRRPRLLEAKAVLTDGRSESDFVLLGADSARRSFSDQVEIDLVEVLAQVTGRGHRAIPDLEIDDFRVLEDGIEQEISKLGRGDDLPLHLALLVDSSSSMADSMSLVRDAIRLFLAEMATERDRVALLTFRNDPEILLPFTALDAPQARSRFEHASQRLIASGGTALRDAVVVGLHYLIGLEGRRALVLITDGIDENSSVRLDETLEYAQRAGVAIYSIGVGVRKVGQFHASAQEVLGYQRAERFLRLLSEESGGRMSVIRGASELAPALEAISRDLRSQYLIAYQSRQSGKDFRRLEVTVQRPGAKVRTVAGYYP